MLICEDFRRHLRQLAASQTDAGEPIREQMSRALSAAVGEVLPEPKVVIYTTSWCPYCRRAKKLLWLKGVDFDEIDVEEEPAKRHEMIDRAGGRTSDPQIFISERAIGGSDELRALEASGQLDRLLNRK